MPISPRAFVPALNKEGLSKLTLTGVDYKSGDKKDEKTGEVRHWELIQINFDCKAKYRGMNAQKVSLTTSITYSPDNSLGKALSALGIAVDDGLNLELDEDGYEVEGISDSLDEDEFEDDEEPEGIDAEALIKPLIGTVYKGKITRGKNGFWGIDVDTLSQLKSK